MFGERTAVGLDVHARTVVGKALDTQTGEVFSARLGPQHPEVLRWLRTVPGPVAVAYEAGPTGYGLARELAAKGIRCVVAAPSKLESAPGDRIKTDARDALRLARLLHRDALVAVTVPSAQQEAARAVTRGRDAVRRDLNRARARVSGLLLCHSRLYTDGGAWTGDHHAWLARQHFPDPATELAYNEALDLVNHLTAKRRRMDRAISDLAAQDPWAQPVTRLRCLRGIETLTAMGLCTEIGTWDRFTGSTIGAFLGLVPSEHSSGATRHQGAVTKSGNTHARRLLVEASWHHQKPYRPGRSLRARWEQAPPAVRARADQGNRRLHQRWQAFDQHHKTTTVANTAIARELAGWCWSLTTMTC